MDHFFVGIVFLFLLDVVKLTTHPTSFSPPTHPTSFSPPTHPTPYSPLTRSPYFYLMNRCPDYNSCKDNSDRIRNCQCDSDCPIYGDCCSDSIFLNETKEKYKPTECIQQRYIRTTCPPEYENQESRYLCENNQNISDPLSTSYVMSSDTLISYKNYHCAICNNDAENLEIWQVEINCESNAYTESTEEELFESLHYNEEYSTWGAWSNDIIHEKVFIPCSLDVKPNIPNNLEIKMRVCGDTISKCPDDWENEEQAEKCRSYQHKIYITEKSYRNFYCALCHKDDVYLSRCQPPPRPPRPPLTTKPHLDFSKSFQLNEEKTYKANLNSCKPCEKGEICDLATYQCSKIQCMFEDLELRDGTCVLKS